LLDLPSEPQIAVYEQTIGPCIQVDWFDDAEQTFNVVKDPVVWRVTVDECKGKSRFGRKTLKDFDGITSGDVAALERANKQVSSEVCKTA
jgi:hypothetical protein